MPFLFILLALADAVTVDNDAAWLLCGTQRVMEDYGVHTCCVSRSLLRGVAYVDDRLARLSLHLHTP